MSTLHIAPLPHAEPAGAIQESAAGVTFGPLLSRRFGRTLGVNNITPKVCPYSCVYCQRGRTVRMGTERKPFHGSRAIALSVTAQVTEARRADEPIDHIAFVPQGEPTLDEGLGRAIHVLRPLGIPVAVVTNGTLLGHPEVREGLSEADHVCIKVDAVREGSWRRVNRPHRRLELSAVLEGMRTFASSYQGVLTTETTLVGGINDGTDDLRATAVFVSSLRPSTAYLSVPTGPTAEEWAKPPSEGVLARAWEMFRSFNPHVELLAGYGDDPPCDAGNPEQDLLAMAAVHPLREMAVRHLLAHAGARWAVVSRLVERGALVEVHCGPHRYYLRPVRGDMNVPGPADPATLSTH